MFLIPLISAAALAVETMGQMPGRNVADMKFGPLPGLPTIMLGSVQSGDPAKGPSIILAKVPAGGTIPWHWHTPTERVMLVSGIAKVEMKEDDPVTLEAGGYAEMPSHHVHQFHAVRDCVLYIYSDAAFDIHYVDGQGNEIAPDVALKAVKETPATGMK